MSFATIHALDLDEKETFSEQIKRLIAQELRTHLLAAIQTSSSKQNTLVSYANSLLAPLTNFQGKQATGLAYPLGNAYEIQTKRLHIQPQKPSSTPWLKAHKLTLRVHNVNSFD